MERREGGGGEVEGEEMEGVRKFTVLSRCLSLERGGDGGSTYSSYCHDVSLSLQLCEEELKNRNCHSPFVYTFLAIYRSRLGVQ